MTILGIDVSHYQGVMDWEKAKAAGTQFAIIKTGEGTTWVDPQFDRNVAECRRLHIVWGAYFYWYPQLDSLAQANHFIELLMGHAPEIGIWGDFEQKSTTVTASQKAARAHIFMDRIDDFYDAGVYTSPNYFTVEMGHPDWAAKYPLWIANYFVSKPTIPLPWTESMLWQDGSSAAGKDYGAQSITIDTDQWMKLESDFDALRGEDVTPIPAGLFQAKCIRPEGVNTLSIPMDQTTDLHNDLINGQIVDVFAVDSVTGWYKIEPDKMRWVTNSPSYVERIGTPIPEPFPVAFTPLIAAQHDVMWKYFSEAHPTVKAE